MAADIKNPDKATQELTADELDLVVGGGGITAGSTTVSRDKKEAEIKVSGSGGLGVKKEEALKKA